MEEKMDRVHNGKVYNSTELTPLCQLNNSKMGVDLGIKLRSADPAELEDWQKNFFSMQLSRSLEKQTKPSVNYRAIGLYILAAVIAATGFIGGLTVYGGVRIAMGALIAVVQLVSDRGNGVKAPETTAADDKNFTFYSYKVEDKFVVKDIENRHFLVLAGVNVQVDKELYDSCDFDDTLIGAVAPTSDGFYFSVNKF